MSEEVSEKLEESSEDHSYQRDQVIEIVNSVIAKVEEADHSINDAVYKQLSDLRNILDGARKEIGLARPSDIKGMHIPIATDELDAVVASTAEATGTIMDCCDEIMTAAGDAGDAGAKIMEEVAKIFEACSFQDITGQRITKVVNTLQDIEEKVEMITKVLGSKVPGMLADENKEGGGEIDAGLIMHGPALPEHAVTQDDIDAILAEFDD